MANLLPLMSSLIIALRYNRFTGRLFAQFGEDTYYEYEGVPPDVVLDILDADSIGHTFDQLVKKGGFTYRRVTRADVLAD